MKERIENPAYVAVNPCRVCAPLGACLAFKGFEKTMSVIHGSQGCATYIRRYIISHYREPIDIASSSLDEEAAVFGGGANLRKAIENVVRQYKPSLIGIVTNCLSETIGDDVAMHVRDMKELDNMPPLAVASAPSYRGGYEDGYFEAVAVAIRALAEPGNTACEGRIAVLPPLMSPADIREIGRIIGLFGAKPLIAPDISDALDGGAWSEYQRLPPGGLPIADLRGIGSVKAAIELGAGNALSPAGAFLNATFGRSVCRTGLPLGISATDALCDLLSSITGTPLPEALQAERSRLVDAYFDGHKYVSGKRAVIVGDEDLCAALALWCREIGITPALIAPTGGVGKIEHMQSAGKISGVADALRIIRDPDFDAITSAAKPLSIDVCFGSGKAYGMARELDAALIRVGFPVHDHFGASRLLTAGYRGAMELFDRVVNALIEKKQAGIPGGYSYI